MPSVSALVGAVPSLLQKYRLRRGYRLVGVQRHRQIIFQRVFTFYQSLVYNISWIMHSRTGNVLSKDWKQDEPEEPYNIVDMKEVSTASNATSLRIDKPKPPHRLLDDWLSLA